MKSSLLLLAVLLALPVPLSRAAEKPAASSDEPKVNYTYYGVVNRVIDGGTVSLDVDLGFVVWMHNQTFKLAGLTAPEPDAAGSAEAMKQKSAVQKVLTKGLEITIQSMKDKKSKTGGYFAVCWKDGVNLNEAIAKANGSATLK